jgi:hypothetical protein
MMTFTKLQEAIRYLKHAIAGLIPALKRAI